MSPLLSHFTVCTNNSVSSWVWRLTDSCWQSRKLELQVSLFSGKNISRELLIVAIVGQLHNRMKFYQCDCDCDCVSLEKHTEQWKQCCWLERGRKWGANYRSSSEHETIQFRSLWQEWESLGPTIWPFLIANTLTLVYNLVHNLYIFPINSGEVWEGGIIGNKDPPPQMWKAKALGAYFRWCLSQGFQCTQRLSRKFYMFPHVIENRNVRPRWP